MAWRRKARWRGRKAGEAGRKKEREGAKERREGANKGREEDEERGKVEEKPMDRWREDRGRRVRQRVKGVGRGVEARRGDKDVVA